MSSPDTEYDIEDLVEEYDLDEENVEYLVRISEQYGTTPTELIEGRAPPQANNLTGWKLKKAALTRCKKSGCKNLVGDEHDYCSEHRD